MHLGIDLGDKCYVPARILRWPLTDDQRDLLEQLIACGIKVDWVNSTTGEIASHTWQQAVKARDWHLVGLLEKLGVGHREGDLPARAVVKCPDWTYTDLLEVARLYPESLENAPTRNDDQLEFSLNPKLVVERLVWCDPVVNSALEARFDEDSRDATEADSLK